MWLHHQIPELVQAEFQCAPKPWIPSCCTDPARCQVAEPCWVWGVCKRTNCGQHVLLSLCGNCHLGAPSLWCTWVVLHRACCTQQGNHPSWKSECKLSARQALCSSCLTEVLSSHFLGVVIIDPPELSHLYPYRGDRSAVLAWGRECLQQAAWFRLPCPSSVSLQGAA